MNRKYNYTSAMRLIIGLRNLWICLTLCRGVIGASESSYLKNATLIDSETRDDQLSTFFTDLGKKSLRIGQMRHVTIVGASTSNLRSVQSAYGIYTLFVVYTEIKEYSNSVVLNSGHVIIIFLDQKTMKTFKDSVGILSRSQPRTILFIFTVDVRIEDISMIFHLCDQRNIMYVGCVHFHNHDHADVYGYHRTENCSMETMLTFSWRPGVGFRTIDGRALKLVNLNGCPVNVSVLNFLPDMEIAKKADGSLSIVGGKEGNLLLTLAEKLNFTLELRHPIVPDSGNLSQKMSVVNDVASGTVEIGIGQLRPMNSIRQLVMFSNKYDDDCITWGVPYVMYWRNNILGVEFSWVVWGWIAAAFVSGCGIVYVDKNFDIFRRRNAGTDHRKLGKSGEVFSVLLDVFSFHLGNAVVHVPKTFVGKLMFLIYLWYAIVMTTGYKSILASLLATYTGTPYIANTEDIIRYNLTVGGTFDDYEILKDQTSENEHSKILTNRFVINNNSTESWNRLKHSRSYALLTRKSYLNFEKKKCLSDHDSITFDTVSNCVLVCYSVIIFNNKSRLQRPVNYVIRCLTEAGILNYWENERENIDNNLKFAQAERYSEELLAYKFQFVFVVYSYCIVICLGVFLIEFLIPRIALVIH